MSTIHTIFNLLYCSVRKTENISDSQTKLPDKDYLEGRLDDAEEIDETSSRLIMDCQEDYSSG